MGKFGPGGRMVAAATSVALVLGTAACRGDDDAAAGPEGGAVEAEWSRLSLPDSTKQAGERVAFSALLPAAGKLPAMAVGVAAEPGQADRAEVWTEDGSFRSDPTELPLPAGRDATVTFAVSDGSATWVGGTLWQAGRPREPFVAQSEDRRAWRLLSLPQAAADAAFAPNTAAAVPGVGLVLLGVDKDVTPTAVLAGAQARVVSLREALPAGLEFHDFAGAAVRGRTIVALGRAAVPGRSDGGVVYRSTDAGTSWTAASGPVAGSLVTSGVAATSSRFVATGGQWHGDRLAAAAWSSSDGLSWTPETVPSLGKYAPAAANDISLGAPSETGGRLAVPIGVTSMLWTAVLERSAAGKWRIAGYTDAWIAPGEDGLAALQPDGSMLLAQSSLNKARIGRLGTSGDWSDLKRAGVQDAGLTMSRFASRAGVSTLLGYTTEVQVNDYAWAQFTSASQYQIGSDGKAADAAWQPAASQQLGSPLMRNNPAGGEIVAGHLLRKNAKGLPIGANVAGWFRSGPKASWQPLRGFATSRTEQLTDLVWAGKSWVAVGYSRPTFSAADVETTAVWTSADGVTWRKETGPFGPPGGGNTGAADVCPLPGGDVLVVGESQTGADERPAAWRRHGASWARVDAGAFGGADAGALTSCLTEGGTTLIQGTDGGRDATWRTTDGATFAMAPLGERGDTFEPVRAVTGGWAAAGTRMSAGHRDAVVWLSKDGRAWQAVAVPAGRPLRGADVTVDGTRLLLATNSTTSPEVWELANPQAFLTS
ncbi:hypothetical protein [Actinoplanes sp. NPDC048796]|uniref:hypothetical protein n=1 Tax=Actinoplanes sp. NPDC048796 TaxID=3155640 RepID=UPI003403743B